MTRLWEAFWAVAVALSEWIPVVPILVVWNLLTYSQFPVR